MPYGKVVKSLVDNITDVDLKDDDGMTPLMVAAEKGCNATA